MVVFFKTFSKFNFGHFFSSPVKLQKGLNLKFKQKFNHGFTNHDNLQYAILIVLHNFMAKRAHEARDYQSLFQNV